MLDFGSPFLLRSWWSRSFLPCRPNTRGGLGTAAVNGGVLAALFDLVTGCTALLVDARRRSATVQLSMRFERPVFGDSVRAEARIDSLGRRTLFASARILGEKGQPCAHCQAVVAVARAEAKPVAPHSRSGRVA
jgi:uncharacterized protein (TIGR00369 family)